MIFYKKNIKDRGVYWGLFYAFALSLFVTSCSGQNNEDNSKVAFESLLQMKGAIVSGYVIDAKSRNIVASVNENYRMTPASLSKIFTSSAALIQLGADYRFKTKIGISSSNIINGVLKGDIIITGGGDPTLGSKYFTSTNPDAVFRKILTSIKESGVTSVSGNLIIVSDYFSQPRYPSLRLWEDMSNYYGAPPAGLSFMDNTFTITLESPPQVNALCKIVSVSPSCDIEIDCRVKASSSPKDSAYIYGVPGLKEWYIDGAIPAGRKEFKVKGAMPFPEKIFGHLLMEYLNKNGMPVNSLSFKSSGETGNVISIGEITSPSLSSIIKVLNKRSVNLFADHLFLSMAKKNGTAGWDNARSIVAAFWESKIGANDIYLHDGSGLSPFNYCSSVDMVKVLTFMFEHESGAVFKESLSISGVDGTLKRIWNTKETKGRVAGKSGYMNGVLGYAGYITTKSNKRLVFSVIVNRFARPVGDVRKLIETEITKIILEN